MPVKPADWSPKPWQRAIAAVVAAGVVVAVVFVLRDVDPGDRTSWAKHVTGALALLFVPGGLASVVVAERVTMWWLTALGWALPIALVWLGVEHWVNWFAFYNPTHGKGRVTTETGARIRGSFVIALGGLAAWVWMLLVRSTLRDRRRPG